MTKSQKYIVLIALFIVPLIFYVLLSTGIHNFAKLPVITPKITDVTVLDSTTTCKDKVSIITFLGGDVDRIQGGVFNLNEEIYKKFLGYKDFQMIAIYPTGKEKEVAILQKKLAAFTDMSKWKFIAASPNQISSFFRGLKTPLQLDNNLFLKEAFIIDKDLQLRGRTADEDTKDGKIIGYDTQKVAILKNKMIDDIKVILAEYRFAFKKNDQRKI